MDGEAGLRPLRIIDAPVFEVIDQRLLPHELKWLRIENPEQAAAAIADMTVRGAPLIGVVAAWGMALAAAEAAAETDPVHHLVKHAVYLKKSRPTAVNLAWAVDRMLDLLEPLAGSPKLTATAIAEAQQIMDDDIETCRMIGVHALELIEREHAHSRRTVNILTHCNAGWLACVEYGTATSGIYQAHAKGIPVHVWVDETRPRNQGANLTAWELARAGVPHTVIADNTGGHLMQHGKVDLVITGTDRTTRTGDVANKIGTYLKALAAKDNGIPFYIALPSSTIDWSIRDGLKEIPIEKRSEDEVKMIRGKYRNEIVDVLVAPEDSPALNYGFDVTPARLISALITERGTCEASEAGLLKLFPEKGDK